MLVHLSGSRDVLAQGLLGKPGGSGTAGDAEGNVIGSMQGSTTWRCCQLLPLPYSSQPHGYIKVLASTFHSIPPHPFSLVFLAVSLSLSQKSYVLSRHSHGAHTTRGSRTGSQSLHPGPVPEHIPAPCLGTLIQAPEFHTVWELRAEQRHSSLVSANTAKTEGCSPVKLINTFFRFSQFLHQ